MGVFKRGHIYWYEFEFDGRRYRASAKTRNKEIAIAAERKRHRELEESKAGVVSIRDDTRLVSEAIDMYLDLYESGHTPRHYQNVVSLLRLFRHQFASRRVIDISETLIRRYIARRQQSNVAARTINMELAEFSRALGRSWKDLWPNISRLREAPSPGRALAADEQHSLIKAATYSKSPVIDIYIQIALLTGMRAGEIRRLTWGQIDFDNRLVTVGQSKSEAGTGRVIPMTDELYHILRDYSLRYVATNCLNFELRPEHYLFPFGERWPLNPRRPMVDIKKAWQGVRARAGVDCRFHDLRHTFLTQLGEAGVPEATMLALAGHMSRTMLERYSHTRLEAKRQAVATIKLPKEKTGTDE